jgi:hypothetical protein
MTRVNSQPSDSQIESICRLIEAGVPRSVAAEACGVAAEQLEAWLWRGRRARRPTPCKKLFLAHREASAKAEVSLIIDLRLLAKKGNPRAAEQLLERLERARQPSVDLGRLLGDLSDPRLVGHDPRAIPLEPGEILDGDERGTHGKVTQPSQNAANQFVTGDLPKTPSVGENTGE